MTDLLTRLDACAECEQAPLAPLLTDAAAEIRRLQLKRGRELHELVERVLLGDAEYPMGELLGMVDAEYHRIKALRWRMIEAGRLLDASP